MHARRALAATMDMHVETGKIHLSQQYGSETHHNLQSNEDQGTGSLRCAHDI